MALPNKTVSGAIADPSILAKYAFFHSSGKVLGEKTFELVDSKVPSSHVMFGTDVLKTPIPYMADESALTTWMGDNSGILTKHTKVTLTEIPFTNGQAYYLDVSGWQKPIITGQFALNASGDASQVLDPILYQSDGSSVIQPSDGVWWVDSYSGVIRFGEGYTPSDMGWGTPQLTCYVYTGDTLDDFVTNISSVVDYEGHTGADGNFSVAGGTLEESLDSVVTQIDAETADFSGASVVGYDGQTGTNGKFSISAGAVDGALDSIVTNVDALENSLGAIITATSGVYNAFSGTNYLDGNASLTEDLTDLDTVAGNIQTEVNAIETAMGTMIDSSGNYVAFSGTNYIDGFGNVASALNALDNQISLNEGMLVDNGLVLNNLKSSIGSAIVDDDGSHIQFSGTNYLDGNLNIAEDLTDLDAQLYSASTLAANALPKAGGTMSGGINMDGSTITGLPTPTADSEPATKAYTDAVAQGLIVKDSVRAATTPSDDLDLTTGGLLTIDGVTLVSGDRVLVKDQTDSSENGIYEVASGSWTRTSDFDGTPSYEIKGGCFTFVQEGTTNADSGWVVTSEGERTPDVDSINFAQFSGAGQITAGDGLGKTGNIVYVNFGAGVSQLPTDQVGVDLYTNAGLFLTENGADPSTSASAQLAIKLEDSSLEFGAGGGLKVAGSATSALQTEIDNIETAMGTVIDDNGDYVAFSGTNYLDANGSVAEDLTDLDTAAGNLQTEVDAIETAMGTVIDDNGDYVAFSGTNYLDANGSVAEDLTDLDTAAGNLQTEVNSIETAMGTVIDDNGDYVAFSGTNYMDSAIDVTGALQALDGGINTAAGNIQTEVDAIETAMGTVIDDNGDYVAFSGTNYLDANGSVAEDLTDLDTVAGNLQTEVDAIEDAMGSVIGTTGAYSAFSGTNYLDGNSSVAADLIDLDTAAGNIQTEVNAIETAMGAIIDNTGNYVSFSGSNYLDSATDVTGAFTALDTAVDTLKTNINNQVYTFTAGSAATQHVITHGLNSEMIEVSVWTQDTDTYFRNHLVGVTIDSANQITVDLTESRIVKVIVRKADALS